MLGIQPFLNSHNGKKPKPKAVKNEQRRFEFFLKNLYQHRKDTCQKNHRTAKHIFHPEDRNFQQ